MSHQQWKSTSFRALAIVLGSGVLACGGGATPSAPTPTTPSANQSPRITSATITPGFVVLQITTFQAHVEATDPDGDALNYSWSYAGTNVGDKADLVFTPCGCRDGSPIIGSPLTVTVTDGKGARAATTVEFATGALTDSFDGLIEDDGRDFYFGIRVAQQGHTVTGTIVDHYGHQGVIDPAEPGRIDSDGQFRFRVKLESLPDFAFVGQLAPNRDPNNPFVGLIATGHISGGRFDGRPFKFWTHDPY